MPSKRKAWPLSFYTYSYRKGGEGPEVRAHKAENPMEYLTLLRQEQARPGVSMVVAEERFDGKRLT